MEEKKPQNELNDILIKRESVEGSRLKNILLVVAALLLFVIIGILAFRIIDSSAKDSPQEIVSQKIEQPSKFGAATAPEVEDSSKTLEDILAKHRGERKEQNATKEADDSVPKMVIEEEKIDLKEQTKFVEIKDEPKQEPKIQDEPKPKEEPKKAVKPAPVKQSVKQAEVKSGSFFVQVESLDKDPRSDYIKELKSKGFGVVVKEKIIDGKTKKRVYVGPYSTREEAAAVLPKIKREINPDAFVIQD